MEPSHDPCAGTCEGRQGFRARAMIEAAARWFTKQDTGTAKYSRSGVRPLRTGNGGTRKKLRCPYARVSVALPGPGCSRPRKEYEIAGLGWWSDCDVGFAFKRRQYRMPWFRIPNGFGDQHGPVFLLVLSAGFLSSFIPMAISGGPLLRWVTLASDPRARERIS